jgi:trehalose 6-phosphate phosphatase
MPAPLLHNQPFYTESEACLTAESSQKLNEFFVSFGGGHQSILLLDYDGTLAPFRVDRFKAVPWAGVRKLLNRLQLQQKTRIAIVTGRPADNISPLLALDSPVEVWGLHGAERLYPDGRRELYRLPDPAREQIEALHAQLRRDSFGGLLEAKPNAAVMHWRGASIKKARHIEERTRALFEPLAQHEGFTLLKFEAGIELRVGPDKSHAVRTILEESAHAGPAAYLGDDITDEAAFKALKDRGLSVLVRKDWRETAADIWLRPPEELRAFLTHWIEAS